MTEQSSIQSRRESRYNSNVDHGDEVVIHESNKMRIVAVPLYIKHKHSDDEFYIKIKTYEKSESSAFGLILSDSRSVSLNPTATKRLGGVISGGLQLAQKEVGDYLLLRISDGNVDYQGMSPEDVIKALMAALEKPDIAAHLSNVELSTEFVSAIRNSIHLSEMKRAIATLREMLDAGEEKEKHYQDWCYDNSWAFGSAYIIRDSERTISNSDKVDLLLPSSASGYRDIIELKSPKYNILNYDSSHQDYYFSSETSKAIGQCHRYIDVFTEEASGGLRDHREIVAYCPRAIVVIGRSNEWEPERVRALRGLNNRLNSIQIMSYDNLLSQCQRMLEMVSSSAAMADSSPDEDWWMES